MKNTYLNKLENKPYYTGYYIKSGRETRIDNLIKEIDSSYNDLTQEELKALDKLNILLTKYK
tara:strand:+ start:31 stop:216 length:186 start_codon:yes stop_codon:yes gene_type:complete